MCSENRPGHPQEGFVAGQDTSHASHRNGEGSSNTPDGQIPIGTYGDASYASREQSSSQSTGKKPSAS